MVDRFIGNIIRRGLHPGADTIVPVTGEQRRLTERLIIPAVEDIRKDMLALRHEIDGQLKKRPDIQIKLRLKNVGYPVGRCGEIRNAVMEHIRRHRGSPAPGLRAIHDFVKAGGVVLPFWAIMESPEGPVFQNAIQIGSAVLDCANDTFNPKDEPVVFYPDVADSPFAVINSFEDIARVAESYWGYDVYPNVYFPYVAPLFPLIAIDPTTHASFYDARHGRRTTIIILISTARVLIEDNLRARNEVGRYFDLSYRFLTQGPYSQKRLPPEYADALFNPHPDSPLGQLARRLPHIINLQESPEDLEWSFARFQIPRTVEELEKQKREIAQIDQLGSIFSNKSLVVMQ